MEKNMCVCVCILNCFAMYPSEDWYFKRLTISSGAVGATGYSSSAVRSVDWHPGDQLDMKYYT